MVEPCLKCREKVSTIKPSCPNPVSLCSLIGLIDGKNDLLNSNNKNDQIVKTLCSYASTAVDQLCSLTDHPSSLSSTYDDSNFISTNESNKRISSLPSLLKTHEKIGHRRVDEIGVVSYKRCPVGELSGALQLGIRWSITALEQTEDRSRDVLLHDFSQVAVVDLPSAGSRNTPSHQFRDYTFRSYAPVAFHNFRSKFYISHQDYLNSICDQEWKELQSAGASGSVFYLSADDRYIIKTVDAKEADFLMSLLPGYYMNLVQNPQTMLPKFFGFYCYQRLDKNIRVVVMNNLVPSNLLVVERYDLKGSRYKRHASEAELKRDSPTLKDLDFMDRHPEGLFLEANVRDAFFRVLERDLRVLRSFEIMDYSLLLAICQLKTGESCEVIYGSEKDDVSIRNNEMVERVM